MDEGTIYCPRCAELVKQPLVKLLNGELVCDQCFHYLGQRNLLPNRSDLVNHPPHYKSHPSGVECITIVEWMNFNRGNAMKYIWRAGEKGDEIEDLEKAAWYLSREITRLKNLKEKEGKITLSGGGPIGPGRTEDIILCGGEKLSHDHDTD